MSPHPTSWRSNKQTSGSYRLSRCSLWWLWHLRRERHRRRLETSAKWEPRTSGGAAVRSWWWQESSPLHKSWNVLRWSHSQKSTVRTLSIKCWELRFPARALFRPASFLHSERLFSPRQRGKPPQSGGGVWYSSVHGQTGALQAPGFLSPRFK